MTSTGQIHSCEPSGNWLLLKASITSITPRDTLILVEQFYTFDLTSVIVFTLI